MYLKTPNATLSRATVIATRAWTPRHIQGDRDRAYARKRLDGNFGLDL